MTLPLGDGQTQQGANGDLTPEERRQVRQMMQSAAFGVFLTRMYVPLLESLTVRLTNPGNTRDTDMCLKGELLFGRRVLDRCCEMAQIPSLFSGRTVVVQQRERPEGDIAQDAPQAEQCKVSRAVSYGSGRSSFPA